MSVQHLGFEVKTITMEELHTLDKNEKFLGLIIDDNSDNDVLKLFSGVDINSPLRRYPTIIFSIHKIRIMGLLREKSISIEIDYLNKPMELNELSHRVNMAKEKFLQDQDLKGLEKLSVISETAAGIAHEIKKPLVIILGQIMLLERSQQAEINESSRSKLELIKDSANRINRIIDNMQSIATGVQREESFTTFENILKEAMFLSENRLYRNDCSIEIENLIEDKSLGIVCNPIQVSQSIANLINNASDAVRKQEERWIKLKTHRPEDQLVQIEVMDSGKGIPKEIKDNIFDTFFSTKTETGGTGMGLSLTRKFLEEAGGSIHLNEEVENTCFEIKIKLAA